MSAIQQIPHITINNILVYILPPSQLSQPLPTHLISTSLIQRHHFLNITPDNPVEYLCWPSPGRDRVIQLLESLATQKDDEERVYHVRYTSDVEYTYAHVRLDDELRLVFQWDRVEMWKYHDANLMPFPPGNHESPEDALADAAADALAGGSIDDELSRISSIEKSFKNTEVNESDDDAYWNGYGIQGESDRPHDQDAQLKKTVAADNGEDAYWAQYATVHGKYYFPFTYHRIIDPSYQGLETQLYPPRYQMIAGKCSILSISNPLRRRHQTTIKTNNLFQSRSLVPRSTTDIPHLSPRLPPP